MVSAADTVSTSAKFGGRRSAVHGQGDHHDNDSVVLSPAPPAQHAGASFLQGHAAEEDQVVDDVTGQAPEFNVDDFFGDDIVDEFIFGPPMPLQSLQSMWRSVSLWGAHLGARFVTALEYAARVLVRHQVPIATLLAIIAANVAM